ncbi:hypothetical protein [Conexibacter sp. S30A1]|uniref:hypothetical protein n=1 Tax=Conexibacter sp. S30A1 TaxID=2937800 RepID=UPI00200C7DD6|nr:hypothetical protein [Conexibacter sp. S30A1]
MTGLSPRRMLAIIETQSEIASAGLALDEVMALVVSRAQAITGAAAAVVELIEGEEMVYHAVSGSAEGFRGVGLSWGLAALAGDDPDTVVLRADAALYDAKRRRGRRTGAMPRA